MRILAMKLAEVACDRDRCKESIHPEMLTELLLLMPSNQENCPSLAWSGIPLPASSASSASPAPITAKPGCLSRRDLPAAPVILRLGLVSVVFYLYLGNILLLSIVLQSADKERVLISI